MAIAIDFRATSPSGETAVVSFLIVEREAAEYLIAKIATWREWDGDILDAGLEGYGGYGPIDEWDGRCPGCRAAWREDWWDESFGSCQVCHYGSVYRFLRREPVWLDLVPFVGFLVDELDDDDPILIDEIQPEAWMDVCPACDVPMTDPWLGDFTTDAGTIVSGCPSCNFFTTFGTGTVYGWTTVDVNRASESTSAVDQARSS